MYNKLLLSFFTCLTLTTFGWGQCNTTDATSCVCKDSTQNNCDLLPDITVSWYALETYLSGPTEYSQTGNGADNGKLKISGSTPNIGHGPLTVRGSDYFVCGSDTTLGDPGVCPDGSAPRQLITQRIYQKSSSSMTYYDRWAGAMTYHPTHGHNHVDDWGVFTLRIEDPNEPNPLNWPIVGDGAKLGFCLMDYGTCSGYQFHCRDTNMYYLQGNTLLNGDFDNWGLGGGNYNCSPVEQGISVGYTDIYSENLDGMWINIPPGTCNGDYWIIADIDPQDFFLEEDESNNWTAIPVTLTQQDAPGNPNFSITSDKGNDLCDGEVVTLTAPAGLNYVWSTGDTTQSIQVTQAGTYDVSLTNHCGTATSSPITLTFAAPVQAPTVSGDTLICEGQSANLTAAGSNITWYDSNGFAVGTGSSFTTPSLMNTTQYFATDATVTAGNIVYSGMFDTTGAPGGYFTGSQSLLFDVITPLTIKSMKVYANGAGNRTIQVLDQGGNLVQGGTYNIPDGESRVTVDFEVPVGTNYQITVAGSPDLFRSNTGVNYPYEITDTVSIHGSTAGGNYYYFFYDWEIEAGGSSCESNAVAHTVQVDTCNGIDDVELTNKLAVFPNPNNGTFNMVFEMPGTGSFTYEVVNILGKRIVYSTVELATGKFQKEINLTDFAKGVYTLKVSIEGQSVSKKFVVQ